MCQAPGTFSGFTKHLATSQNHLGADGGQLSVVNAGSGDQSISEQEGRRSNTSLGHVVQLPANGEPHAGGELELGPRALGGNVGSLT